jgi:hypothetical protein
MPNGPGGGSGAGATATQYDRGSTAQLGHGFCLIEFSSRRYDAIATP